MSLFQLLRFYSNSVKVSMPWNFLSLRKNMGVQQTPATSSIFPLLETWKWLNYCPHALFNQRGIHKVDEIWKLFSKRSFTAQCLLGQSSFMKDGSSNMCFQMPLDSGSDSFSGSFIDILALRLKSMWYRPGWKTDIQCNIKKLTTFPEVNFVPSQNSKQK